MQFLWLHVLDLILFTLRLVCCSRIINAFRGVSCTKIKQSMAVHGSPTGPSTCPSEHPKVQWFIFTSIIRDHPKLQVSLQFSTCLSWWWISRHIRAASILVVLGTRLSASQLVESAAHHEDLDSLAAPVEDADRSRFCQAAIWSAKVFKI